MGVQSALEILKNPDSTGMSLVVAIDKVFKGQCFAWEFDTIFSELEEEYSIVLSPEAADRVMALLSVKANPAHLWDGAVFSNLVETLNFNECLTDTYEQCSPGECCWALTELEMFGNHYNLSFHKDLYNDEPRIFIACCLAADGWMVLPEDLDFCRDEFMRTSSLDKHVSKEKERLILDLAAKKEFEFTDENDPVQVQVAKIRECKLYVSKLKKDLSRDLGNLTSIL